MNGEKYILSFAPQVGTAAENGAVIKPKRDVIQSSLELGYKEVIALEDLHFNKFANIPVQKRELFKRLVHRVVRNRIKKSNLSVLNKLFDRLSMEDTLLVQYPIYGEHGPEIFNLLCKRIPRLKIKNKIILIHDLESIDRSFNTILSKELEWSFIKSFDHIIVHNEIMERLFSNESGENTYHRLGVFDFRLEEDTCAPVGITYSQEKRLTVVFAGNLAKAPFITHLSKVSNIDFHIYGPYFPKDLEAKNIFYHGSLSSEELIAQSGRYDYGLVWDGDDINGLSGNFGEYMKLNNPYKFSSNIVAGLPIITASEAAIAPFIKQHNLGIVVNSLMELNDLILSKTEYIRMKESVMGMRDKLIKGERVKEVLSQI